MLIVGRAVAGMGSSGLQNGALTIMAAAVPMQKRPGMYDRQQLELTPYEDRLTIYISSFAGDDDGW